MLRKWTGLKYLVIKLVLVALPTVVSFGFSGQSLAPNSLRCGAASRAHAGQTGKLHGQRRTASQWLMQTKFAPIRGTPVKKSVVVPADLEKCYEITADFDQTLAWARKNGMRQVNVLERNGDGLGSKVEFVAKAPMGLDIENVLLYQYSAPKKIEFRSVSGNVIKTLDGSYSFEPQAGGTKISYELSAIFPFNVPGFIQEQITGIIASTAVVELKNYIMKQK